MQHRLLYTNTSHITPDRSICVCIIFNRAAAVVVVTNTCLLVLIKMTSLTVLVMMMMVGGRMAQFAPGVPPPKTGRDSVNNETIITDPVVMI